MASVTAGVAGPQGSDLSTAGPFYLFTAVVVWLLKCLSSVDSIPLGPANIRLCSFKAWFLATRHGDEPVEGRVSAVGCQRGVGWDRRGERRWEKLQPTREALTIPKYA